MNKSSLLLSHFHKLIDTIEDDKAITLLEKASIESGWLTRTIHLGSGPKNRKKALKKEISKFLSNTTIEIVTKTLEKFSNRYLKQYRQKRARLDYFFLTQFFLLLILLFSGIFASSFFSSFVFIAVVSGIALFTAIFYFIEKRALIKIEKLLHLFESNKKEFFLLLGLNENPLKDKMFEEAMTRVTREVYLYTKGQDFLKQRLVDILIMAPIPTEFISLKKHLKQIDKIEDPITKANFTIGMVESNAGKLQIGLYQPGKGNLKMTLATERAVRLLNPNIALLVGVAGGIKDVEKGDIVVGEKVYDYESRKVNKKGNLARPDGLPYSLSLIEKARKIAMNHNYEFEINGTAQNIFLGAHASGSRVVGSKNTPEFHYIEEHLNDAYIVEMEGIGFSQALQAYPHIHNLSIRAISDCLDNKKKLDKIGFQKIAAKNAAHFAFELIRQLDKSLLK